MLIYVHVFPHPFPYSYLNPHVMRFNVPMDNMVFVYEPCSIKYYHMFLTLYCLCFCMFEDKILNLTSCMFELVHHTKLMCFTLHESFSLKRSLKYHIFDMISIEFHSRKNRVFTTRDILMQTSS